MPAAARIQDVFEEIERAPPVREIILALPANATDNQIAAIAKDQRSMVAAWEARARESVQGLIAWKDPSPGIREIQRATVNYLRAVHNKFLVLLGKDLSDLSVALNDPARLVSREAALQLGAEIVKLRSHQVQVLDDLISSLAACLSEVPETPVTALSAPGEQVVPPAFVATNSPAEDPHNGELPLLWAGCTGVALALLGVALPWLDHDAALIVAPFGFALWWAAGEALQRSQNAEA